jgi:phosphatidylethanolamine/phosphatidyl-N-methylethanolamine N-methyltransferase
MRYWSQCGNFLREFRRHFRTTGAILPSSRFLARALVAELRKPRLPGRILEVGPGTGSVTKEIVSQLLPGDQVDAVEINEHFLQLLRRRIDNEWLFREHRGAIHLIHSPVEDLPGAGLYDYIVSGLPLNNFPIAQVRRIFRAYDRLLKPGGTLTYYEYVFIRQLKTPFSNRRERRRLHGVGRLVREYIRDFQVGRERIFINVPPATVRHLRFKPVTPLTKEAVKAATASPRLAT